MREAENVRRWRMTEGDWAEQPVEKVETNKRVIFELGSRSSSISVNDPSGKLLDRLIGLCFSGPEYLSHDDAARHIALLHELKKFNCMNWRRVKPVQMNVADFSISELGMALADWVQSYFEDKRCALMPAYALDTAIFIEKHVSGHFQLDPEWWEIRPMVDAGERNLFRFLDTRFKSNFTSNFAGTIVRCRVPQESAIKFRDRILIAPGDEFCAVIKRCHLSTNFQDAIYLQTATPDETSFRLDLRFWFVGEVPLSGEGSLHQWFSDPEAYPVKPVLLPECGQSLYGFARFDLNLPANWVIAAAEGRTEEIQLVPVPCWDAEIGKNRASAMTKSLLSSPPDIKVQ